MTRSSFTKALVFVCTGFALATVAVFPAYAAHKEHGSPFGWPFIFSLINFTILVVALYFILKNPAREFFRKRSTDTRLEMDKAKKYYDDAAKQFKDIDERLKQSDAEAKKLLESLRQEGASEKQHIVRQAHELADKIREDSERIIKQEVKRAQEVLKAETVLLASELASKSLASSLTADDQVNLGQEFIAQIRAKG